MSLRTYTLREADKICLLLTREAGKVRGVAHGARRMRSRFGSSLEPFTEVAITYFQKETRELVSISNCEIIRSQISDGISSEMLGVIHYLAELLIEFLPDHEPNERVYRLLASTLEALRASSDSDLATIVRYFEIWLLRLSGFLPELRHCGRCQRDLTREASVFIPADGAALCASCGAGRGEELRPDARALIREMMKQKPLDFAGERRDPGALSQSPPFRPGSFNARSSAI